MNPQTRQIISPLIHWLEASGQWDSLSRLACASKETLGILRAEFKSLESLIIEEGNVPWAITNPASLFVCLPNLRELRFKGTLGLDEFPVWDRWAILKRLKAAALPRNISAWFESFCIYPVRERDFDEDYGPRAEDALEREDYCSKSLMEPIAPSGAVRLQSSFVSVVAWEGFTYDELKMGVSRLTYDAWHSLIAGKRVRHVYFDFVCLGISEPLFWGLLSRAP